MTLTDAVSRDFDRLEEMTTQELIRVMRRLDVELTSHIEHEPVAPDFETLDADVVDGIDYGMVMTELEVGRDYQVDRVEPTDAASATSGLLVRNPAGEIVAQPGQTLVDERVVD